ncbi:SdiA-regulated domain-containing protein [Salinimicrobium catena]|uniref:SdiA-regulated domain-containing protein n=1 Tax=Salinimicrobium catena TaxID=390640 RepID=UPI002FE4EEC5
MGINKTVTLITVGLVAIISIMVLALERKSRGQARLFTDGVKIEKTWELPDVLEEVSGIVFLDAQRVACVQDEKGMVYIYDLSSEEIVREIHFAGNGDYEGIAVAKNVLYVVKSNGSIYEITNFSSEEPKVTEHSTRLSRNNDVEGLFFDKNKNRLLLVVKEKDPQAKDYKGIYAFDLAQKKLLKAPAYKMRFEGRPFGRADRDDVQNIFKPSEVAMNSAGEIFVLEGENPQLLVLDPSGKTKALYRLDKDDFPQPEGLAFDPAGNLYISNEGKPGTIHKVKID